MLQFSAGGPEISGVGRERPDYARAKLGLAVSAVAAWKESHIMLGHHRSMLVLVEPRGGVEEALVVAVVPMVALMWNASSRGAD